MPNVVKTNFADLYEWFDSSNKRGELTLTCICDV